MEESEESGNGLPDFLRDPKGLVRRRWRWMLPVVGLGVVVTVAVVATIPVRYLATATILVSAQQIPEDFVRSTVPDDPFERINAMVGEITSRERLAALIEEHGLYPEERRTSDIVDLVGLMRSNMEIAQERGLGPSSRDRTSSIYAVRFRDADPAKAAAVANDMASLLTAASTRIRGQQARLATQFLRSELERTEAELREQDRKITEFKESYRGELPSELNTNLAKLERLGSQRTSVSQQLADAETRLAMLTTTGDPTETSSPAARLAALRSALATELAINTEEHPNVISLRRQVETLEAELESGAVPAENRSPDATRPILIRSAQRDIDDLRRMLTEIDAEIAERETRVASTPAREEELTALEERATVLRENYLEFLRKVQAAELSESLESAQQGERVSVLDRALPPRQPERTRIKYLFAGVFASLAAAAMLGCALELWDPVLTSPDQIEKDFDLPVLGSVPRIS